jgi:hypothetical protein
LISFLKFVSFPSGIQHTKSKSTPLYFVGHYNTLIPRGRYTGREGQLGHLSPHFWREGAVGFSPFTFVTKNFLTKDDEMRITRIKKY